ncbi:MAG: SDR family oxidoreductase [Actinomycetes bacterium]
MRVYAVSGSASGIGKATVEQLQSEGHRVITLDIHHADISADLSKPEGVSLAVAGIAEQLDGPLDGLVTCAGLGGKPDRSGSTLTDLNYFGTVDLIEGLFEHFGDHGASIVAISSNSVTIQPGYSLAITEALLEGDRQKAAALADAAGSLETYPASKLAIARWVRRNAVQERFTTRGIRINAIAPGMVETAMVAELRADEIVGPMMGSLPIPLGRAGKASEIAALISLVLSERGGYFLGSVILVDGGTEALLRADDWPQRWTF